MYFNLLRSKRLSIREYWKLYRQQNWITKLHLAVLFYLLMATVFAAVMILANPSIFALSNQSVSNPNYVSLVFAFALMLITWFAIKISFLKMRLNQLEGFTSA